MGNNTLKARDLYVVEGPCDSADVLYQGDMVWWDAANSKFELMSAQTDQLSEELNQVLAAQRFAGHVYRPAPAGVTTVAVSLPHHVRAHEVTVPSGTYRLFSLLGQSETGGTTLQDQVLEAVTLVEEATHVVVDDLSTTRTSVLAAPIGSFAHLSSGKQGFIPLPIFGWQGAAGVALAAFANGASAVPGYAVVDSEAVGIRWNNHANPEKVITTFAWPPDADRSKDAKFCAIVSKTGATVGDATTLTLTAFNQVPTALHDADANYGGASDAVVGDAAAKTLTKLTRTLAAADLPASWPASTSLTVGPTDGTLGTDDFVLHSTWIEYQKLPNA